MEPYKKDLIAVIAIDIYLRLSKRKRKKFLKWYQKNNWDVQGIFSKCYEEAYYLSEEIDKKNSDSKLKSN